MMMNSLFALIGLVLLAQCQDQVIPKLEPQDPTYGKAFVLDNGATVEITGTGADTLTLELESLNDSRCPQDVVCVWLGNATVNLRVSDKQKKSSLLEFCIGDCRPEPVRNKHTLQTSLGAKSYEITLLEVLPLPSSESNIPANQVKLLVKPLN